MVGTGPILKSLYPKQSHVACVAHILHNCAMKVQSHFKNNDQLIAKVKSATVRNKTRQAKFLTHGSPPQSVVTSRTRWLNAPLHYVKNLPETKAIVESFERSGILLTQAKVSLQATALATQILKVK